MENNKPKIDWTTTLYGMSVAIAGFSICAMFAVSKSGGESTSLGCALAGILPGNVDISFAFCALFAVFGAVGGAAVGLTLAYLKRFEKDQDNTKN